MTISTKTIWTGAFVLSHILLLQCTAAQASRSFVSLRRGRKRQQGKKIGTFLTLQRPTAERVSRWFENVQKNLEFNHESVGMTKPRATLTDVNNTTASVKTDNATNAWFPPCPCGEDSSWRVLRYRRRVGRGESCYERVRDFALGWEFSDTSESNKGILRVHINKDAGSRLNDSFQNADLHNGDLAFTKEAQQKVIPVWSGPHTSRRLITYSAASASKSRKKKTPRFLPKLYAVSPVVVVYDVVDERGPGTTYSSTAYATLRGHWLSGEERVTVARRDGLDDHVDLEILSCSRPAPSIWGKIVWPLIGPMQNNFFESQMDALEQIARSNGGSS